MCGELEGGGEGKGKGKREEGRCVEIIWSVIVCVVVYSILLQL